MKPRIPYQNWFHIPEIRALRTAKQEHVTLVNFEKISNLAFLSKPYIDTKNLVPLPNYDTCRVEQITELESIIKNIRASTKKFTTVLVPFQVKSSLFWKEFSSIHSNLIFRTDSFEIELCRTIGELEMKASKRKRSKIRKFNQSGLDFSVKRVIDVDTFTKHYFHAVNVTGLTSKQTLGNHDIQTIVKNKNTYLFSAENREGHVLSHLVGLNLARTNAEFVLSVFNNEIARGFSTELHWYTVTYLKGKNIKGYHLGGGGAAGDGIEDFKRQLGGERYSNFCVPIVNDIEKFSSYYSGKSTPDFFPPYLQRT